MNYNFVEIKKNTGTFLCILAILLIPVYVGIVPMAHAAGGLDFGYDYGYDTGAYDYGYDYGAYDYGYDTGTYDYGYDYGAYDYGYDTGAYDYGYDYGAYDYGYDTGAYDYGYDTGTYDYGYDYGAYDYGYDTGAYDYGYDTGAYDYGYDGVSGGYTPTWHYAGSVVEDTYTFPSYEIPTYSVSGGCISCSSSAYPIKSTYSTPNTYYTPSFVSVPNTVSKSNSKSVSNATAVANASATNNVNVVNNVTTTQNTVSTGSPFVQPICNISANPTNVSYGGSSTLSWNSSNATSATLSGFGAVAPNSSRLISNITGTQTYTLSVSGSGGSNTCSTTVVASQQQNAPTCSINVSPSSIVQGGSAALNWSSSNATSANITNIGSVSTSGSQNVSPSNTSNYTMTVWNSTGQTNTCNTTLNVGTTQPSNLYCTISASPSTIQNGAASTLVWNSYGNATSAMLSDGIGSVSTNGSLSVRPASSRNYTLTITDAQGRVNTCATNVNVQGSYVALTQVPYTGFGDGLMATVLSLLGMLAIAGSASFLLVSYRRTLISALRAVRS